MLTGYLTNLSLLLCFYLLFFNILAASSGVQNEPCKKDDRRIRREWDTLSVSERRNFVSAVQCLVSQPSNLSRFGYPSAINHFLDFATLRAERTHTILYNGYTLTWHRYYLWLFESALRSVCGYDGALPYWDFSRAGRFGNHTIFNGSGSSLSGNGASLDSDPIQLGPALQIPGGSGGDCVEHGPFAAMRTTMLPLPLSYLFGNLPMPILALEANENCLIRDFNEYAHTTWITAANVSSAVRAETLADLQTAFDGIIGGTSLGLMAGLSFAVGGHMSSIHSAAQDPLFYPAWCMLDRIYASWQKKHPELADDVYGTKTLLNLPPSRNVTLRSLLPDWGNLEARRLRVGELISTTGGATCYEYDSLIV